MSSESASMNTICVILGTGLGLQVFEPRHYWFTVAAVGILLALYFVGWLLERDSQNGQIIRKRLRLPAAFLIVAWIGAFVFFEFRSLDQSNDRSGVDYHTKESDIDRLLRYKQEKDAWGPRTR